MKCQRPDCQNELTTQKKFCSRICRNVMSSSAGAKATGNKLRGTTMSVEQKQKISSTLMGSKHSRETRQKMSRTRKGKFFTSTHRKRIARTLASKYASGELGTFGWGKKGKYTSTKTGITERYDSSFELRRFQFLDATPEVKTWTKRHKIKIAYVHNYDLHWYIPDILVETMDGRGILEEVKGFVHQPDVFRAKCQAAERFCGSKNLKYRIVWEKDLETLF